jgi:hypothetical protein
MQARPHGTVLGGLQPYQCRPIDFSSLHIAVRVKPFAVLLIPILNQQLSHNHDLLTKAYFSPLDGGSFQGLEAADLGIKDLLVDLMKRNLLLLTKLLPERQGEANRPLYLVGLGLLTTQTPPIHKQAMSLQATSTNRLGCQSTRFVADPLMVKARLRSKVLIYNLDKCDLSRASLASEEPLFGQVNVAILLSLDKSMQMTHRTTITTVQGLPLVTGRQHRWFAWL